MLEEVIIDLLLAISQFERYQQGLYSSCLSRSLRDVCVSSSKAHRTHKSIPIYMIESINLLGNHFVKFFVVTHSYNCVGHASSERRTRSRNINDKRLVGSKTLPSLEP